MRDERPARAIPSPLRRLIRALAGLGVSSDDDDAIRGQKAALTLAASLISVLAVV